MAHIHWYPGHIAKAERKLKEQLNLVDIVIEVVDARLPLSSRYDNIEALIANKPRLILLNKADLADPKKSEKWVNYLTETTKCPVILTSSNSSKDLSLVVKKSLELGKDKILKLMEKGLLPRPVRAMIIGMPNVGKSSVINKLIKTSKVKVGAKAGITRTSQWVRINPKLELLDTPGIIPLKLEDQVKATKLAMVNSVSENAYEHIEVAQDLANLLYKMYPSELLEYYKVEDEPTIGTIAIARNWLASGNEPDIHRCATLVLSDFRHGRIGRFTLDEMP